MRILGENGKTVKYFTGPVKSEKNFTEDWRGFEAKTVEFEEFLQIIYSILIISQYKKELQKNFTVHRAFSDG